MSALNVAEEMSVAVPERADATTTHPTRPFLWSIRRELWENPSIIAAPAVIASIHRPRHPLRCCPLHRSILSQVGHDKFRSIEPRGPAAPSCSGSFSASRWCGVAIFYSLDALLSERRDRSILFWKSLPVSDTTTVLSKMAVPMVVLPIVTFPRGRLPTSSSSSSRRLRCSPITSL